MTKFLQILTELAMCYKLVHFDSFLFIFINWFIFHGNYLMWNLLFWWWGRATSIYNLGVCAH